MSFFKFSRENNIPVTIHTLRMIRATLLYDTIAVRICKEVDRFEEYLKFRKFRERQAKKRVTKNLRKQAKRGLDDSIFLRVEEVAKTGEKLMWRTRNMLSSPVYNFSSLIGKWVFTLSLTLKLFGRLFMISSLGALIFAGINLVSGQSLLPMDIGRALVSNEIYLTIIAILTFTNTRHILFRIRDQEV